MRLLRFSHCIVALALVCGACTPSNDGLRQGFNAPPPSARPRVWWHWMNGNISKEGAQLDLAWLQRVGIGGVQLFEGGLATPLMVKKRLVFMSPEWRDALTTSVDTAHRLGLEMSITTSPGWSATGGPWVKPDQAMQKLVWSETLIHGGASFNAMLPALPAVAGPYQDIPLSAIEPSDWIGDSHGFVRDAAVIAYRQSGTDDAMAHAPRVSASIGAVDGALLRDGRYAQAIMLPADPAKGPGWIALDYGQPVTVRSVSVGMPGKRGFGAPKPADARLEASDDGIIFRPVTTLLPTRSPIRSAGFAPVTARWFRLSVEPGRGASFADDLFPAPGAVLPPFQPGNAAYGVSELVLSSRARIDHVEEKAGFATADDYYAIPTSPTAVDHSIDTCDVIDLTAHMQLDGHLDWTPPAGDWRVIRFGYSPTGHPNGPAPAEATGLEVDKLSARHVSDYLDTYLGMYRDVLGPDRMGKTGVGSLLSDSIEAGPQNWTQDMIGEFTRRRGYDPRPWMPALTGVVIGGAEASDRFLWDFRRTIAELTAQAHYGTIAKAAHTRGLSYYSEALEDGRPSLGDDMEMRTPADIPMGALWMLPTSGKPTLTYVADIKGAASVAHLYDKAFVASETFTVGGRPWAMSPRDLKSTADLAFTLGVNRIIYHTSPHQPFTDGTAPGVAMMTFVGQYFDRNETWAEQAKPWIDYLSRSDFMLQQGKFVADIGYFYGEEAPLTGLYQHKLMSDVPVGHDYDFINAAALRDQLSVAPNGDLVTPDGVRYPILMLGGSSRKMTLATLRRLRTLVESGATIVGIRPEGTPSEADDVEAFAREAAALWADAGIARAGKGRIFADLPSALAARALAPDWDTGGADVDIAAIHRRTPDAEIYFVVNRRPTAARFDMSFRVAGRDVQFWHADTGKAAPASFTIANGRTTVPMSLEPNESVFVVFRGNSGVLSRHLTAPMVSPLMALDADWSLSFQPNRGAPTDPLRLDRLASWSVSPLPGVQHFSGTGTYTRSVTVPARKGTGRIMLDLGDVRDIAEVTINDQPVGTLWKPPYRVDVTDHLRPGANSLQVKVTNLWVNRLIGDAQPDAKQHYTAIPTPAYRPDAPLLPSGLIGPVRLEQEQ